MLCQTVFLFSLILRRVHSSAHSLSRRQVCIYVHLSKCDINDALKTMAARNHFSFRQHRANAFSVIHSSLNLAYPFPYSAISHISSIEIAFRDGMRSMRVAFGFAVENNLDLFCKHLFFVIYELR